MSRGEVERGGAVSPAEVKLVRRTLDVLGFILIAYLLFTLDVSLGHLRHRVVLLERACGVVYTGGGVWQCAQPNVTQTAKEQR